MTKLPFLAVEHEAADRHVGGRNRRSQSAEGRHEGYMKAATREYDALPTHYMSAPLAGAHDVQRRR